MDTKTREFILAHRTDDVRTLALQASRYAGVDMTAALVQIEGWQKLRRKVPSWTEIEGPDFEKQGPESETEGLLYPPQLSVEQCSSEETARYKASVACRLLPKCDKMADLTGGFGVDFVFLARRFRQALYVERNPVLCELARHNFPLLGVPDARIVEGDGCDLPSGETWDLVYFDPARRDRAGRKTVSIADCEPDASRLLSLLSGRAALVMIKLSPMLDLHSALTGLPGICELHVVSVGGECRELLACVRPGFAGEATVCCACGDRHFRFRLTEEAGAVPSLSLPLTYLYEPDAALLKAGAYRLTAVRYGLHKLHANSHLYTSDALCSDFPGRVFRVEAYGGFGKKEVRGLLSDLRAANLTVRNFPATVAELRRRLRLAEGGDCYLFATTGPDGRHLLVRCRR